MGYKYDFAGNVTVLNNMLTEMEAYCLRYPRLWDMIEKTKEYKAQGLLIIASSKDMDDPQNKYPFVEIRRKTGGTCCFYDYFDGKAKKSFPERISRRLEHGIMMRGPPTPEILATDFRREIEKPLAAAISAELADLEKRLLE